MNKSTGRTQAAQLHMETVLKIDDKQNNTDAGGQTPGGLIRRVLGQGMHQYCSAHGWKDLSGGITLVMPMGDVEQENPREELLVDRFYARGYTRFGERMFFPDIMLLLGSHT